MDSKLFIFIAASMTSLFWTWLPDHHFTLLCFISAIVCGLLRKIRFLSLGFIGLLWMASVGYWQYSLQLPLSQFKQDIAVSGEVGSLLHAQQNPRFNFTLTAINGEQLNWPRTVRLSWNQAKWPLKQGQKLRLKVRLKPPHGLANQGSFNYQQWLFSENISATGYVKTSEFNQLTDATSTFRQLLLDHIMTLELDQQGWIAALTLGYRGLLSDDDWQTVQALGIAHLIAISGLHLALVGSLVYLLLAGIGGAVFSRFPVCHQLNLHRLALAGTLLASLAYAALAGFDLPVMRAWLMLALLTTVFLARLNIRVVRLLLLSVALFVVVFPLSLFGLSFWLSFIAVLIIVFIFWRWPAAKHHGALLNGLLVMLKIQLALSLLMLPLVAWQFSYISWSSPLVNLLAVPLVTLCLVPLGLTAVMMIPLFPALSHSGFIVLDKILGFAVYLAQSLQHQPWNVSQVAAFPAPVWGFIALAMICRFLPPVTQFRRFAWIFSLPLVSYLLPAVAQGWRIDVLDVGQGSAVLISRGTHAMMYDVGPAYPSGFNMAEAVILPLLRQRGISTLDMVFISHWDNDHSGSLAALERSIPIIQLVTTSDICLKGQRLSWQGLSIEVLWPDGAEGYNDNNGSCVIRVADQWRSVLLPGDIDAAMEKRLVKQSGQLLKSDILLASHHGSNSSSADEFIRAVAPDYVVYSQGFMNRWHFPRQEVIQRFARISTTQLLTSEQGQVSFILPDQPPTDIQLQTFRQDFYPYWYANFPADDN